MMLRDNPMIRLDVLIDRLKEGDRGKPGVCGCSARLGRGQSKAINV